MNGQDNWAPWLPCLVWGTSAVEHPETAIVGLDVQLGPEERLDTHEAAFNYLLS